MRLTWICVVKNYWLPGMENLNQDNSLSGGKNNAYFVANECVNTQLRTGYMENAKFDMTLCKRPYPHASWQPRREPGLPYAAAGDLHPSQSGRWYREQNISSVQLTGDFLLKYDRELGANFHFTGNFGGNIINQNYRRQAQTADKLKQAAVYSLANSLGEIKVDNYG